MPTQFSNMRLKADTREATPNAAAQRHRGEAFGLHSVAKNISNLFFHAVPVTARPPLKSSLHAIFQISDDQLRHGEFTTSVIS